MGTPIFNIPSVGGRTRPRASHSHGARAGRRQTDEGFLCKHCHNYVCSAAALSGVQNRNHCPYCLWSRHLDLIEAGDRLSACKALMRPIGLTFKATNKRYGPGRGELMLIHLCIECEGLSINRIAADDDPQDVFAVFEISSRLDMPSLAVRGILPLTAGDSELVRAQLFGARIGG
ncbi:MAG TPA: RNHCP domain-containing protein [Anaerolineales bacterium]|nr:RNHCP domain-containing protein [Anaerolineales bacterium]